MTDKELRKLSRADLISIMLDLAKENRRLQEELNQARQELEKRTIAIENAGSLAAAAMELSGVFEAAEDACAQYTRNLQDRSSRIREICDQMELQTQEKCRRMMEQTRADADAYWEHVRREVRKMYEMGAAGQGRK